MKPPLPIPQPLHRPSLPSLLTGLTRQMCHTCSLVLTRNSPLPQRGPALEHRRSHPNPANCLQNIQPHIDTPTTPPGAMPPHAARIGKKRSCQVPRLRPSSRCLAPPSGAPRGHRDSRPPCLLPDLHSHVQRIQTPFAAYGRTTHYPPK